MTFACDWIFENRNLNTPNLPFEKVIFAKDGNV